MADKKNYCTKKMVHIKVVGVKRLISQSGQSA